MSADRSEDRRLISITRGNLLNDHIYLTGHRDFFPDESYGRSSKKDGQGRPLTLFVKGLKDPVETDIATRDKDASPRSMFRRRAWVRQFFEKHEIGEGDIVAIERVREFSYRIYPLDSKHVRGGVGRVPDLLPLYSQEELSKTGCRKSGTSPTRDNDTVISQAEAPGWDAIANGAKNTLWPEDRPAHCWYRFVLSFPPQLVRGYLRRFRLTPGHLVLDPFCGTGTTLVECKKLRIASIGLEAHPMAALASRVKTDWSIDPSGLLQHARKIARSAEKHLASDVADLWSLPEDTHKLLLKNSISPLPLHKTLVLLEHLRTDEQAPGREHALLALANALIQDIGNLHFGPEVGVRDIKEDAPVLNSWLANVGRIASDLEHLRYRRSVPTKVFCHDSRTMLKRLKPRSVDGVITSPPYPNEKDYTRTTRLETVLLGFVKDRRDLRALKENLLRSNTRNVYKNDDDDKWIESFPQIAALAEDIESRRIELRKTSGFERQYARVTKLYFGGMARHLADLRRVLSPGAHLAYVVGDQASYLRVMIRTGQLLGRIAESLGYEVETIELFRTRLSTATKAQLREEVLVLKWPG